MVLKRSAAKRCLMALLAGLVMAVPALPSDQTPDYQVRLKLMLNGIGEPADTPADLEAALHSKYDAVRCTALEFFSQQQGECFIPTLKQFLADKSVLVRYTAAGLLAGFGDSSALEQMRADYQDLLPPGAKPEDPGDPTQMNLVKLDHALQVGRVLAELGDNRALPLALRASQHELPVVRSGAVRILGRIARDGEDRVESRVAFERLITIANNDKDRGVHGAISGAAINMEPRSAVKLLDAFSQSPHIPEWLRKVTLERKVEKEQTLRVDGTGTPATTTRPGAAPPAAVSTQTATSGPSVIVGNSAGDCFWQLLPKHEHPGKRAMLTNLKLEGTANGGELVLLEMHIPNPRYIAIDTRQGETAETVLARMAAAVVENRPFNPHQAWPIRAEGNLLKSFPGSPGSYLFAGTETGLSIPPPPTSLSASYDREHQQLSLAWENPGELYDAIGGSLGVQPGTSTRMVQPYPLPTRRPPGSEREDFNDRRDDGLRRFYVVGCRGGVLSNAAVITWDFDDDSQAELDVQPFTAGVGPNWRRWSYGKDSNSLVLEQGTKGGWKRLDQNPKRVLKPDEKRFFQWIKTRSADVTGGVCRKFLGLEGGHTYRVYTRMNTFEMDKAEGAWSFSFHAAAHAKGVTLTPEQMAGAAAPPDGNSGSLAGQVAAYGPGATTKGKFEEVSTEKKAGPHSPLDITLPPEAEVITVWFRYHGPPSGGVGFDWIKLKDVTALKN